MFLEGAEFMLVASCNSTVSANWIFPLQTSCRLFEDCKILNPRLAIGCIVASLLFFCSSKWCSLTHLVILSYVFSPWRSHYPLSAAVSGPFVSRLRQSGPSLRENVRPSWRKFISTETSRLKQQKSDQGASSN